MRIAWLLPKALIERNFVNMRFGFNAEYVKVNLKNLPVRLDGEYTKPPRLLEFNNKSETASGMQGKIWRILDFFDRIRNQRAWCQLSYVKL